MDDFKLWLKVRWKQLAIIACLVAALVVAGLYYFFWNRDPAEGAVNGLFAAIDEGRIDEAMEYVDPESGLAVYWNENEDEVQDKVRRALADYDVSFKLKLETVRQGNVAQVSLAGGTVKVSSREQGAGGAAMPFSLKSLDLVFYVERKGGLWLVTGINQDLDQLMEGFGY